MITVAPNTLPEGVYECACGRLHARGYKCPGAASVGAAQVEHRGRQACAAAGSIAAPSKPRPGQKHEDELASQLTAAGFRVVTFREWLSICETDDADDGTIIVRQYPFGLRCDPPRRYRSDFACPRWRVLIEVCGGAHAAGRKRVARDIERDGISGSLGYGVIKVTPESVQDGTAMRLIQAALSADQGRT